MDSQSTSNSQNGTTDVTRPQSRLISERGVKTGADFANLMSALMSDIISGAVTPEVGNAACNAGGKLLKIVEMQYKYGARSNGTPTRELLLAPNIGGNGE